MNDKKITATFNYQTPQEHSSFDQHFTANDFKYNFPFTQYHFLKSCHFENTELNLFQLLKLNLEKCTGNILIQQEVSSLSHIQQTKQQASMLKEANPLLTLKVNFILNKSFKNLDDLLKIDLTADYFTLTFCEYRFEEPLNFSSIKNITLDGCHGNFKICENEIIDIHQLNINNSHLESFDIKNIKISSISIQHSDLSKAHIENLNLDSLTICKYTQGNFDITKNTIQNLSLEQNNKHRSFKLLYLLPLLILLIHTYLAYYQNYKLALGILATVVCTSLIKNSYIEKIKIGTNNIFIKILNHSIWIICLFILFIPYTVNDYEILSFFNSLMNSFSSTKSDKLTANISFLIITLYPIFVFGIFFICRNIFLYHTLHRIQLIFKNNTITLLKYKKKFNINNYLFFINRDIDLKLIDNTITKTDLGQENFDGLDSSEQIFLMAEESKHYFSDFTQFKEIHNDKDIEFYNFFLINKKKLYSFLQNNGKDLKLRASTIFSLFFYLFLSFIYPLFYRLKNTFLSLIATFFIGLFIFNTSNMTIADTTVQTYLKTTPQKIESTQNRPIFYNIKNDKNTIIKAPDFYPDYSTFSYTLGRLIPLIDNDQNKLYHPNNKLTYFFSLLYKMLGFLYAAAFSLRIIKRILPT